MAVWRESPRWARWDTGLQPSMSILSWDLHPIVEIISLQLFMGPWRRRSALTSTAACKETTGLRVLKVGFEREGIPDPGSHHFVGINGEAITTSQGPHQADIPVPHHPMNATYDRSLVALPALFATSARRLGRKSKHCSRSKQDFRRDSLQFELCVLSRTSSSP